MLLKSECVRQRGPICLVWSLRFKGRNKDQDERSKLKLKNRGFYHEWRNYCLSPVFKLSNNLKSWASEGLNPHWPGILNQIRALGLVTVSVLVWVWVPAMVHIHRNPPVYSKLLTAENNWLVHLQAYQPSSECAASYHYPSSIFTSILFFTV